MNILTIEEPSREIPVSGIFDVIVVGGGISGVAASVAEARNSASVCLIEKRVSNVIIENKNERSALTCKAVIDVTGDADVCYAASEKTVSLDSNLPAGWFYTFNVGRLKRHTFSNKFCSTGTRSGSFKTIAAITRSRESICYLLIRASRKYKNACTNFQT